MKRFPQTTCLGSGGESARTEPLLGNVMPNTELTHLRIMWLLFLGGFLFCQIPTLFVHIYLITSLPALDVEASTLILTFRPLTSRGILRVSLNLSKRTCFCSPGFYQLDQGEQTFPVKSQERVNILGFGVHPISAWQRLSSDTAL